MVVSEYYVWSADLSGRQIRTFANLKVRAPDRQRTYANLKAHLLGLSSCRAPDEYARGKKRQLNEVLFLERPILVRHGLFVWLFRSIMFGAPTLQVGK